MKLDTAVIILKGMCYVSVGAFTPWTAALAQWVNSGEWPPKIVWIGVILPASFVGAGSQLLSFLSGSWRTYSEARRNGVEAPALDEPPPKKP